MKIEQYVKIFKALSHITRLKIVLLLSEKNLCVCEITEILETSQPRISQHLKVLKDTQLVKEEVSGPLRIYQLKKDILESYLNGFSKLFNTSLSENDELQEYSKTIVKLGDSMRR